MSEVIDDLDRLNELLGAIPLEYHRGCTRQWRGRLDRGVRNLGHEKQAEPHRTEPEDRRGGLDIGVEIAHIQGREDAERCRQCRSRVVTLQRQPTAPGDDSGRLHVELSRLL